MAILQVVSARAGHLTLFSTLIMLALATSSAAFAAVRAGWLRALAAAAAAFLLGLAAEWAGTGTAVLEAARHRAGRHDEPGRRPAALGQFAVWQDGAALDHFLTSSPVAGWRMAGRETWSVRLRYAGGHGRWAGRDPFAGRWPPPRSRASRSPC